MRRLIAALAAALFIAAPLAARAQIAPTYADSAPGSDDAQIHGRILSFDGAYTVQVRDEKGYVDAVQLHQGTIINPTGLTLAPGMIVSIMGYNAGSFFAANEIDTPYTYYYGRPYYQGHPWDYYGPSISLGFFFGNAGWWHGGGFYGSPRYVGGVRYYNNTSVHINAVYRGGNFAGRNYVAPPERGGYVRAGGYVGGGYAHSSGYARGGFAPGAARGGNGGGDHPESHRDRDGHR
jgi:hypothetical protein